MYLLDTDHVVILQRQSTAERRILSTRMEAHAPTDFIISIVTFHEQVAGWQAYLNRKHDAHQVVRAYNEFERILEAFAVVQLIGFDAPAADQFAELRRARIRIGTMDLRIASIALVNDYTVLTRNRIDFEKVPNLKIEDWSAPVPDKPR